MKVFVRFTIRNDKNRFSVKKNITMWIFLLKSRAWGVTMDDVHCDLQGSLRGDLLVPLQEVLDVLSDLVLVWKIQILD